MNWYYDIVDGEKMDIYDHNGDLIETIQNDGSGFQLPTSVEKVMKNEIEKAPCNDIRIKRILACLQSNSIEEGKPNLDDKTLDEVEQIRLKTIREEAQGIIGAKWPAYKQRNADSGIYPQEIKDQKDQDIADVIEASNNAEDKVANADTIEEVETVEPDWPTI